MRLPINHSIESRDGTLDKDAKMVNVYKDVKLGRIAMATRPGISTRTSNLAGFGAGLGGQTTTLVFTSTIFGVLSETSTSQSWASTLNPISTNAQLVGRGNNGYVLYPSISTLAIWYIDNLSTGTWQLLQANAASTSPLTTTSPHLIGYTFNNTTVIATGVTISWMTSHDLTTWSQGLTDWNTIPPLQDQNPPLGAVVHNNELYFYGYTRSFHTSTPGVSSSWVTTALTGALGGDVRGFIAVHLGSDVYAINGSSSSTTSYRYPQIWKSVDGSSFAVHQSSAPWGTTTPANVLNYNNSLFAMRSNNADGVIWSSVDASTWVSTTYTTTVIVSTTRWGVNVSSGISGVTVNNVYSFQQNVTNSTTVPLYVSTVSTISNPNEVFVWSIETP